MNRLNVFGRPGQSVFFQAVSAVLPLLLSIGCASDNGETSIEPVANEELALDPIGTCNQDPRVNSGLVPLAVCAGARVFFDEKFNGNGRSCGTCHPAANNYTIDQRFIASLPATDPLFAGDAPALASLETPALRTNEALIKENVDGFQDVNHKFVSRATPHTLSLATSLARDPADNTSAAVVQRTGWSGDGAPGDGSLRNFIDGAINQHYPKVIPRVEGPSFRFSTNAEKDQILAFQLALGRTADINLAAVTLADSQASAGKTAFMDPLVGRCNECHANAGANSLVTGKNTNFNTGTIKAPATLAAAVGTFPNGSQMFDGGFGATQLFSALDPNGALDSFGDGTFNTAPLIEAADTAPFFHANAFGQAFDPTAAMESGVAFYSTGLFLDSPAAKKLDEKFGGAQAQVGPNILIIARFLRVLNASFNLAIAKQRMDASRTLNIQYWGYRDDIQKGLLNLASKEIADAIGVLQTAPAAPNPLHPTQVASLTTARTTLAEAVAATDPGVRKTKTEAAIALVVAAKAAFGTNMNFQLGTGNLMF